MANISGRLQRVADPNTGGASENGSVEIALWNFGSQMPKDDKGTIVRISYPIEPANPANAEWTAVVAGNDIIRPAGTYYTVTYKNSNDDITQVEAYYFLDGTDYNLDFTDPFDPTQPPGPLPPRIISELQVFGGGEHVADGDKFTAFQFIIDQDSGADIANAQAGNLYTFIVVQDGAGNHLFSWPQTVHNATFVNPEPSSITIQTFVCDSESNLYAIGPGTYWP